VLGGIRCAIGGTLGCASGSGQGWSNPSGSAWSIRSGAAYGVAPAGDESWTQIQTTLSATEHLTVVLPARPSGTSASGYAGVFVRGSADLSSLVWVGVSPLGAIDVWDLANNAWTEAPGFPTASNATADASASRTLTVDVLNSTVSIAIGTYSGSATTSVGSGAYFGLYSQNTDASSLNWPTFDQFTVT
jgi:hypothetical protein